MYFIGYDIGSSSVKACLVEAETGAIVASDFFPKVEMKIIANKPGWAEQEPQEWWNNLKLAHNSVMTKANIKGEDIKAIGITWQMHGLVLVDKAQNVLRPSIIWCDSRAVPYGEKAFKEIGEEKCLSRLLNSPGNFTASKLAWVKEHEPHIFEKTDKLMLPGDYIAMRLSNETGVTIEGLSEGMFWDFKTKSLSDDVLNYYGIPKSFIPGIRPVFGIQATVSSAAAKELGLKEGTPITYRAGDQPNNALSLNVFNPGEIASTAGTSGVVYGVLDKLDYDKKSRVNTFAHVNYTKELTRLGVLLCINGTAILNTWIKNTVAPEGIGYADMNVLAESVPVGSEGVSIIPFGNGAERVLSNEEPNCSIHGINFLRHGKAHLIRAAHEGIAFSFKYGMDVMNGMGIETKTIRAGHANLFLSPVFRQTLADVTGATIELYNTDGSAGAARGAGIGLGVFKDEKEAFSTLKKIITVTPEKENESAGLEAYERWLKALKN